MTTRLPHALAAVLLAILPLSAARTMASPAKAPTTPAVDPTWIDALDKAAAQRPDNPFTSEPLSWLPTRLSAADPSGGSESSPLPYLGPVDERPAPEAVDAESIEHDDLSGALSEAATVYCAPGGSGGGYGLHLMPQGLIYKSYLAGVKESRFRSVWNHERDDGNIWDITLGGNVGILRYGTRGDVRPEGIQLGIEGAGEVRLDTDINRDVNAVDFRFGIPITWGDSFHQEKLAYYHLSSHVGDEYLLRTPGFNRLNYSRDVIVWGESFYVRENLRIYGEAGYGVYVDVADPWEFQFGVDWAPMGRTGGRGAPFAAVNGHLREELDYGGTFVFQTGWCWRRGPATGLFRVGFEYYNGKDDQFSFFNEGVEKYGFGIWYDY
jgi:hypothetical protein